MKIISKTYLKGIGWFVLSLFCSSINDVIQKLVINELSVIQITFLRFFFSTITLIPWMIHYGIDVIKTSYPYLQIFRGILLFIGMWTWTYGLSLVPISTATIMSFSVPIFVLLLAIFFLKENIKWQRWITIIIGFACVYIALSPDLREFNYNVLIFIIASLNFAALDIINKKSVNLDSIISMLFYPNIVVTILSSFIAINNWQNPDTIQLLMVFILGCNANFMLFCLLKALLLVEATALAPYRYLELIFSSSIAYIVFTEIPNVNSLCGAFGLIIIGLFLAISEILNKKQYNK